MGSLFGSSKSANTSTSNSSPWEPAQGALKNILSQAEKLYNEKGGINAEWVDKEIANLTPEMQATVKDLLASDEMKGVAANIAQSAQQGSAGIGTATGALSGMAGGNTSITSDQINKMAQDLYQSDMVKQQKAQLSEDVNKGLSGQIRDLNQQAVASGNMGSSRAGVAEGVATTGAAKAIAQGGAAIENAARDSAYSQALGTLQGNQQTQLSSATSLGNIGVQSGYLQGTAGGLYNQALENQLKAAGITQDQAQNILDNQYFNTTGANNAGWANLGNYLTTGTSIGGLGASQTNVGGSGNSGWQNALGLGSLGVGMMGIGQQAGWFSDASLKKNVKRKKKGEAGKDAEYSWEWNKSAKSSKGLEGKASGVLAQQIAKEKPEAVAKGPGGALMVDYNQTTANPTGSFKGQKGQ